MMINDPSTNLVSDKSKHLDQTIELKMPVLVLHTNVPRDKMPDSLTSKLSDVIQGGIINKAKDRINIAIHYGNKMYFGGSGEEPSAVAQLTSVGGLGLEVNKKLCAGITKVLEEELKIPPNRTMITFDMKTATDVGLRGILVSNIVPEKLVL